MGSPGEVELVSPRANTKPMERTPRPAAPSSELKAERPTIKTQTQPMPRTRTASPRAKSPTAQAQGTPPIRPKVPNAGAYSVSKQRGQEASQPFERVVIGATGTTLVAKASTLPTKSASTPVEVVAVGSSLAVQVGEHAVVLTRREARALVDKLRAALKS